MACAVTGQARVHSTERCTASATPGEGSDRTRNGEKVLRRFREQVELGDSLCLSKTQGRSGEPLAQTLTALCHDNGY